MQGTKMVYKRKTMKKKLFICTKPYQYLMCRLILKGYNFESADIIVLNHFKQAGNFAMKLKQLNIWNRVYFIDDSKLNKRSSNLTPIQKFWFYNNWQRILPAININYNDYDGLYFAHEGVAVEYAIMRKFKKDRKTATIYEEGYGNYININTHNSVKSFLKSISHLFNIPGSYIGRLKFVDRILLQYPEVAKKLNLPILRKVEKLPITLPMFLRDPTIQKELKNLFPSIPALPKNYNLDAFLILGESYLSDIGYGDFIEKIVDYIKSSFSEERPIIFFKQHPGEFLTPATLPITNLIIIPAILPIEMFYSYVLNNGIKTLHIYTFGSTAVINLHMMLANTCQTKVTLLESSKIPYKYKLSADRFKQLSKFLGIKYKILKL